jgi:hypothetical protein
MMIRAGLNKLKQYLKSKKSSQPAAQPSMRQSTTKHLWRSTLWLVTGLLIVGSSIWFSCAFWVQLALISWLKWLLITVWIGFSAALCVVMCKTHHSSVRYRGVLAYLIVCAIGMMWWQGIKPSNDRVWAAEVAEALDSQQHGNMVTLEHVRNFDWKTETEFTPHWETRQYDLSKLATVDVITSYWMGPSIAHVLVSFGFDDGRYVSFSIETRKEKHEEFSLIGGFFRMYELSLVAADERDILYTRSNVRGEKLYLYRVGLPKKDIQTLFVSYLAEANQLKQQARFYNTLTSNCTTIAFNMAQAVVPTLPFDYRIMLTGYLPEYLYEQKALDQRYSFAELKKMAYINPRAIEYAQSSDQSSEAYSKAIRAGIPVLPAS